jgi:hypothetical protein
VQKQLSLIFVMLALTDSCFPTVIPVPPSESDIQGVWIAAPSESSGLCRLVLTNSRSLFALSYEMEKPMVYSIGSWSLDKAGRITLKTTPTSTNAFSIVVKGKATRSRIRIVISSPDGGWQDETVLHREETVEARLRDLKKSMEQFEKR